jgi:glycosyltransferase involved in cell wall biosynthesis
LNADVYAPLSQLNADAVYFLMSGNWKNELRSNRWHFARQWSRYLPVTMLQPELDCGAETRSESVDGIANCRLLYIRASRWGTDSWVDADQIEQVYRDMRTRNICRPILWLYNPNLVSLFATIPAVARIVHATESYFDWEGARQTFLNKLRLCGAIADLIIPVSSGVESCFRTNVKQSNYLLLTNGCDYETYSRGSPDQYLTDLKSNFKRIAIYAGNINERLDYQLLLRCAQSMPGVCFALFGPVSFLTLSEANLWNSVIRLPNVRYMGAVEPDRIPDLYAAADVGIIPYKETPFIRDRGFALKALEMIAAGLPVISTMMRPMLGVSNELQVAEQSEEFLEALSKADRSKLSSMQQVAMREVASRYDYGRRFPDVVGATKNIIGLNPAPRARLEEYRQALSSGELGISIGSDARVPDFCGDDPQVYLTSLMKALRVDRSVTARYLRRIRSSSLASAAHRSIISSPSATALVRFAKNWLPSSRRSR